MRKGIRTKKAHRQEHHSLDKERDITVYFLEMLNTIKLFHWKTTNYAVHKATDDLHSKLSGNVDTFVETMLGKHGGRVILTHHHTMQLKDYSHVEPFKQEIERYKTFLIELTHKLNATSDSDLLNTRDEMLGHLNQMSYLLTLH